MRHHERYGVPAVVRQPTERSRRRRFPTTSSGRLQLIIGHRVPPPSTASLKPTASIRVPASTVPQPVPGVTELTVGGVMSWTVIVKVFVTDAPNESVLCTQMVYGSILPGS